MPVTIVIPLFTHERYITAALGSLLSQTRPPDRVIVVDDGSTDGSLEAARSVTDSRVTVVSQQNGGAHNALNRAIAMADGSDFIGILNSDDLYERERIEKCLRCLELNPGAAAVVTRLKIIDESGVPLGEADPRARWLRSVWQARPESLTAWLGIANFTKTTSNLFGRAEYFRAHPFRPYRYVHDYYFALAAALEDRLAVLDEELLLYRVHGGNTIKSGPTDKLPREVLRMNVDLLRAFAPALGESAEVRARLADYFRTLSRNYADFRFEPFLHLVARQFSALSDAEAESLCESLDPARFPELLGGKSNALRETLAVASYERLLESLGSSRWLALGRLLGTSPPLLSDAPTVEGRLAALRKACAASAWFRLGQKLGLVYGEMND
ncbi:MAG: glycosyltransferase family 2 protein [Chthoniobacteraceae bacterium]